MKLACEYELHTKVSTAQDHGENYMTVRPPWSAIFYVIVYLELLQVSLLGCQKLEKGSSTILDKATCLEIGGREGLVNHARSENRSLLKPNS